MAVIAHQANGVEVVSLFNKLFVQHPKISLLFFVQCEIPLTVMSSPHLMKGQIRF